MLAIVSQPYKSPQVNVGMPFHKQEDWAKNPKHRAELDFQFLSTRLSLKKKKTKNTSSVAAPNPVTLLRPRTPPCGSVLSAESM